MPTSWKNMTLNFWKTMSDSLKPQLLEYALDPALRAFSTTRQGGVSRDNYASFNINAYCGDEADSIRQNKQALCDELGIEPQRLIMPHQTHTACVRVVDEAFFASSAAEQQAALEGVDALITDQARLCIGVSTADCVPVLLADKDQRVVAAIHAGWRGTQAGIAANAVETMCRTFNLRAADLRAVIGPSISMQAFEVGQEVYDAFAATGQFPMSQIARRYPSKEGAEKWHIDLWAANFLTLEQCGLPMEHIQVSGVCTYTQSDRFFSARRLGINSGRIFTGIMKK